MIDWPRLHACCMFGSSERDRVFGLKVVLLPNWSERDLFVAFQSCTNDSCLPKMEVMQLMMSHFPSSLCVTVY